MPEVALGLITQVRSRGDPGGWTGLMMEHAEGRFSEMSLNATADVTSPQTDIQIGPGFSLRPG